MIAEQLRRAVPGGIGTYVRGLLSGLDAPVDVALDVTLHASRPPATDPLTEFGYPVVSSALPAAVLTRLWDRGLVGEPGGYDVVHATALAAPTRPRAPRSMLVHDLAWRHHPEVYPARGRRWHETALRRALRETDLLMSPSIETAEALRAAGADRVEVVEHGANHLPPADHAAASALLEGLGVASPFLLTVSTLEPRKNLARILEAYSRARAELPEPWPLLVVGPKGWGEDVQPVPGAHLTGFVSEATLAALYATARCLVYVPLEEGFGLPAVEAMQAALPVVASPMPSTGGAALEVDPLDVEAIAAAISTAAGDDRRRSALVTAGLMRTRDLTWERCAARHVELWREIAR